MAGLTYESEEKALISVDNINKNLSNEKIESPDVSVIVCSA